MSSTAATNVPTTEDDARLAHLGLPAAAQPGARAVRQLLGRVHLPVADGRHLLPVRARPGHRRAGLHLADLDPGRAGMLLVALVFGELASHYPVAGALYQYSKYSVGRRFGWFVGWFYGIALLVTVASVDTGVGHLRHRAGPQLVRLELRPGRPHGHPGRHAGLLLIQTTAQHHRRHGHGPGRPVRRLRRDRRHPRHRDHPGDPRLPPRAGFPVLAPSRSSTPPATRSGWTSAATGSPAPR